MQLHVIDIVPSWQQQMLQLESVISHHGDVLGDKIRKPTRIEVRMASGWEHTAHKVYLQVDFHMKHKNRSEIRKWTRSRFDSWLRWSFAHGLTVSIGSHW